MNKTNLKAYAPQARRDFIAAVAARANLLGISAAGTAPASVRGDLVIIEGREWPAKVNAQREKLVRRIERRGFEQAMEEVAYTWFNRFAALRFMELHGYLNHGWRVLSSRDGGLPEILRHASDVSLPGLNAQTAREMHLAGTQDNELYKLLLVAQCNDLSRSMPFLFEHIDDETELLLPENLLRTDSIVAKLVESVPDEDWEQIEAVGWLYQFYISEKKDQVIGKVVKNEDIPAATQLFTPNWIVKYLAQNTVGRLWATANPTSRLRADWEYLIDMPQQADDVQASIDALVAARIAEDGDRINPETIKFIDPACGSGHILVEAYDLFKSIYLERGYRPRDIPRLILEKNLHGIDIDDRAAQLAGFALLMKARADDRRLLDDPPQLNVLALQESGALDVNESVVHLSTYGVSKSELNAIAHLFSGAKTYGSLITIPSELHVRLASIAAGLSQAMGSGDLYAKAYAEDVLPLVRQALLLGARFDAVVANPPYMGSRYYSAPLKKFAEANYKEAKGDLYTCFMTRNVAFARPGAAVGMITIPNWMFLSTFEAFRSWLFDNVSIETFSHNGRGVFGSDFGSCAFTFRCQPLAEYRGRYKRLFDRHSNVASNEELAAAFGEAATFEASTAEFKKVPGSPVAYWISNKTRDVFTLGRPIGAVFDARQGLATANNGVYLRYWFEVNHARIGFSCANRDDARASGKKWFPYNKGGAFRKWYGNQEYVVDWADDGQALRTSTHGAVIRNPDYYFREAVSWSDITIAENAFRYVPAGFINDSTAHCVFGADDQRNLLLSFCNNRFSSEMIKVLNPSVHFHIGYFNRLPYPEKIASADFSFVDDLVRMAKEDWDSFETSWSFEGFPLVQSPHKRETVEDSWAAWRSHKVDHKRLAKELEERSNRLFIEAYGLDGEYPSEVDESQITLASADRELDTQRLVSYAIGCAMGRYSPDAPGLVYVGERGAGFDANRYQSFPADDDGIVPITLEPWFEDDAANWVRDFVARMWGRDALDGNLAWMAIGLGSKGSETAEETLRRYLAEKFFKDHAQTYKRRPIYWQFSSGKLGAFQALVYQHRYNEGTIARLRSEYVIPLTSKMASRLEIMEADGAAATSTTARTKIQKQIDALRKKQAELLAYDEKLRHYADMRISIDLDDGVKANYARFGDLVADSKTITGGSDD